MNSTDIYGASAAEWLDRWDRNELVWTVSMGGLGPGYEQAIQITAAEVLRHILDAGYDAGAWRGDDNSQWLEDRDAIEKAALASPVIDGLGGISGAQYGAAVSLATTLYMRGPAEALADPAIKDRLIQCRREFPSAARPSQEGGADRE